MLACSLENADGELMRTGHSGYFDRNSVIYTCSYFNIIKASVL